MQFPAFCGSLRWTCCPVVMNYTTSGDALPWSGPSSHTGETLTSQTEAGTMSSTDQGQLLFSSTALHLCVCVFSSNMLENTHACLCVGIRQCWIAYSSRGRGQASAPAALIWQGGSVFRRRSGSRGCRILNLASECPHLCLSCCFMNPLLHTSARQPKRPFVILIVHL